MMSQQPPREGLESDGPLFGRDAEQERVRAFCHDAGTGGAALVLTGEPGVGKSALLETAVEQVVATGGRVIRATGLQFQTAVTFAGLDQLVAPLRAQLDDISPSYRRALMVALGLAGGPASVFPVVCNAALSLFRRAAAERPLLIAVDDAHWLDPPSASVLSFVARRLSGSRVGLLAASRTEPGEFLDAAGLPELEVAPLGEEPAAALLGTHFPLLAASVHQRLLVEAGGNPLALLELPTELSSGQQAAREPLPQALPLNRRLDAVFTTQLGAVPESTRDLLLVLALEGSGDLDLLQATRADDPLPLLAPAERARLVLVDAAAGRAVFRHPLVGAAVVNHALPLTRRRAHQRLAEVLPPHSERRAWHLAEATVDPDEEVAQLLEAAAQRSRARGDLTGAARVLTRAAQLSADRNAQLRRVLAAAYLVAETTGDLETASQLLDDATHTAPQLVESLPAAAAAANLLLNADCQIDAAHRVLTTAIRAQPSGDGASDAALVDALHSLVMVCWVGGRAELWAPLEAQLAQLGPAPPQVLDLCARSFGDPARDAAAGLSQLDRLIAGLGEVHDPIEISRVGIAAVYTDRLGGCRPALQRVIEQGRAGGAVALAINALVSCCVDDWQRGQWHEALSLCQEGITLSRRYGYSRYTFVLSGYLEALIQAARGDREQSLLAAHQLVDWARPRGVGIAVAFAHHIAIVAAQGVEDFETTYQEAVAISPAGVLARYAPHSLWVLLDLVEAAVRTNRRAEAEAHVAAMEAAGIAGISSRLELVVTACSAFVARGPEALDRFAAALAVPGADQWRFDHARVQLAYAEQLGHARAVAQAREQLLAALSTFEVLGAQAWAARARRALQATGLGLAPHSTSWVVSLTPQEREVAELAASGLTNKQIGHALFLSPRTVSTRLYHLFPKLGITTRAALRDALAGAVDDGGPTGTEEPTRTDDRTRTDDWTSTDDRTSTDGRTRTDGWTRTGQAD